MKVQAALNLGTSDYPEHALQAGQIGDVPDQVGALMLARGHAVEIKPEPKAETKPPEPDPVDAEAEREKPKQKTSK